MDGAIVRIATALSNRSTSRCEAACTLWNYDLDTSVGRAGAALVYDGVMYVTDAKATVAIDIETGKQMWNTPSIGRNEMTRGGLLRSLEQGTRPSWMAGSFRNYPRRVC